MHSKNPDSRIHGITRRRALQTIGAGALAATVAGTDGLKRASAATAPTPADAPKPVPPRVQPFSLADVRLLDGPFKDAQQRDAKYLLSLEPDRLLHNFRVNAGLQPKAPVYGGWESVQTWADIRAHGHTLGHYLSACAMMFASTDGTVADEFKKRCDTIVAELQECQKAAKTGLINAFPDNTAQFDNFVAGRRVIGVPWYTMHKIFAGLRDAHIQTQNAAALDVLVKLSDWAVTITQPLTDAQFERMLNTEHGGMNEVLADVFALTGDAKYLALAQRFSHKAILNPLAQSKDALDTLHSNTQIPKIVGFHRIHLLTGLANYLAAAQFFWKTVTTNRSFATGGNGDNEHFFPAEFARHLTSAKTMETCCSHNMLKLTRSLFTLEPDVAYADYYERTLYNTILASQDPDSGMMTYFQSTRPGYMKLFCTPVDSFWCCTGTGIENHSKYGDSIYFRGADAQDNSLYINLFISSTLNWKEKGFALKQTTTFPEAGKTKLEITAAGNSPVTLQIRHPSWSAKATLTINGSPAESSAKPGSYVAVNRVWKAGDVIEVDLPMTLRTELLHGTTDEVAVVYGPIVLVGALGTQGMTPKADIVVNERTIGTQMNDTIEVPTFSGAPAKLVEKIEPTDKPLTFKTKGLAKPTEVTLVPYYSTAHQRYNMYWKVTPA